MKMKILLLVGALCATLFLGAYSFYHDGEDKGELLARLIMNRIEAYHYQPQVVDDQFSEKVFEEYLESVDYSKHFLTREDSTNLSRFAQRIDDELTNATFEFFNLSVNLLERRITEVEAMLIPLTEEPFDFEKDESFAADPEKMGFAADEAALRERFRKELKYRTLLRLHDAIKAQEKAADDEEVEKKSFAELEEEARMATRKNYVRYFERLAKMDENDRRGAYFNAVTSIYDPHTNYIPPRDQENFDITLSGRLEGIGALLGKEGQYIRVEEIVPGSASSRQGELQVSDLITKVTQADTKESIDVVGMEVTDAVKFIRGKKGTKVILTVRKADGTTADIGIVRDVVEIEETFAKSAIVKDANSDQSFGFIHLPRFYVNFKDMNSRRAATDVAKEVAKLDRAGVDGIILDLRYNPGGSLPDAIEMAGLFVEEGPIVQVKFRTRDPRVLSDPDKDVKYTGPLVVLVNSFSASSSEIVAAALQDYERAVIVGSPSTYGKGSVQSLLDLDEQVRGVPEWKPLGEMKLTTQKFYRINGGATQLRGVIPDIVLPDEYSKLDVGEKDYEYSMPWDEIDPVRYTAWEGGVSAMVPSLKKKSQARVRKNKTFQLIEANADRYLRRQERESYPLSLEAFEADAEKIEKEAARFKDIRKPIEGFEVSYVPEDQAFIDSAESRQARYKKWSKNLREDVYVFEAVQILQDMTRN